jgi:hypothetical protein
MQPITIIQEYPIHNSYLNHSFINARASSSHVGPIVIGLFLKEEKVEWEVPGGP